MKKIYLILMLHGISIPSPSMEEYGLIGGGSVIGASLLVYATYSVLIKGRTQPKMPSGVFFEHDLNNFQKIVSPDDVANEIVGIKGNEQLAKEFQNKMDRAVKQQSFKKITGVEDNDSPLDIKKKFNTAKEKIQNDSRYTDEMKNKKISDLEKVYPDFFKQAQDKQKQVHDNSQKSIKQAVAESDEYANEAKFQALEANASGTPFTNGNDELRISEE